MKLVSYFKDGQDQLAFLAGGLLYDTDLMHPDLPVSMGMFLNYWDDVFPVAQGLYRIISEGKVSRQQGIALRVSRFLHLFRILLVAGMPMHSASMLSRQEGTGKPK